MHFSDDGKFVRTDIWREGDYLDLWSVPHFLSGVSIGLAAHFVGFEMLPTFIIVLLILVGYEMFEALAKIEETRMNRFLDVVVGLTSFTPTYFLSAFLSTIDAASIFLGVTLVDSVLSWFGWIASKKAAVLEAKFRLELQEQAVKLREKRDEIQEKLHERRTRKKAKKARIALSEAQKKDITTSVVQ